MLRDLSLAEPECACRGRGVIVDAQGRFALCECPSGTREYDAALRNGRTDPGSVAYYVGRKASEVMDELLQRRKNAEN